MLKKKILAFTIIAFAFLNINMIAFANDIGIENPIVQNEGSHESENVVTGTDADISSLNYADEAEHNWDSFYTIDKEATCTEEGQKSIHCADCDEVKDVTIIEKVAHKYGDWIVDKEATCTEKGIKHKVCSVCGDTITDTIKLAEHTVVIDEAVAPSCTTSGLTEGSHCSVCGEVLIKQEKIPATGHTEVVDEAVPATEKENGLTEGKHCSVCGEVLVEQKVVKSILQYNGVYYEVDPFSSYSISKAITLESGETYYRKYSSNWHSRQWYSKFVIKKNTYAFIGLTAKNYYNVTILDEEGITVCDLGSQREYLGYFPLKEGTYYLLLSNGYSTNSVVLSYDLSGQVNCEVEPNDSFSTATEIKLNQEYLIFSGQRGNKDYLSFNVSSDSKIKIIVDNYEEASPYMDLYEKDRATYTSIRLKYDENIEKYYYEFIPKYNGIYYIETHSFSEEKVYGITIQSSTLGSWKKNSTGWWFQLPDGSNPANCWKKINGTWYHFNTSGYMDTNWIKINEKWYYLGNDGAMRIGWQKVNNKWYYLSSDGAMQTGWQKIDNKWYYLNTSMQTGWQKINNKWYYLNTSMQTGWQKINNKWYYLGNDGAMRTGWQKINNKWYYLNTSMQTGWQKINNKWYYFDSNGVMQTGNQYINGKWYNLGSNGAMQ